MLGGLYFGPEVLVPLPLAILISFALYRAPPQVGPRVPSVVATVSIVVVLLTGFGVIGTTQPIDLGENLPTYGRISAAKSGALQGTAASGGMIDRLSTMAQDLSRDLQAGSGRPATRSADGSRTGYQPVPVEIYERPSSEAAGVRCR